MKNVIATTLLLAGILSLGGCSRGPDISDLQRDLQTQLNAGFGEGLFRIQSFKRHGSQPLSSEEGDERQRLAVYYKAELELLRDHRFSDWSGQNVGALHQVLGSAGKGIDGIEAKGNRAGDILLAHGFGVYAATDSGWVTVPFSVEPTGEVPEGPGVVAEIDTDERLLQRRGPSWPQKIASQLQEITAAMAAQQMSDDSVDLRSELQSVLTRAQLKMLRKSAQAVLLSGSEGGNYQALAQGLEKVLASSGAEVVVVPSSGAIENINLLRSGLATLALTQSDLVVAAHNGSGIFAGQPSSNLRAVAALYPEPVQIVVRKGAGITSLGNLAGKRVNIGADGTGTQANARQILALAGVNVSGFSRLDVATSVVELMAGRLDALFVTGALPSRYLQGVGEQVGLLALDEEIIRTLSGQLGYTPYQIPAGIYPGVDQSITTVAVTALLVADERAPDAQITTVLTGLFDASVELSEFGERGGSLDRTRALDGIAVPLHRAAAAFFQKGAVK